MSAWRCSVYRAQVRLRLDECPRRLVCVRCTVNPTIDSFPLWKTTEPKIKAKLFDRSFSVATYNVTGSKIQNVSSPSCVCACRLNKNTWKHIFYYCCCCILTSLCVASSCRVSITASLRISTFFDFCHLSLVSGHFSRQSWIYYPPNVTHIAFCSVVKREIISFFFFIFFTLFCALFILLHFSGVFGRISKWFFP